MKSTLHQLGIGILVIGSLLAGCTGTPTDDGVLPTIAVLPSLTPTPPAVVEPSATPQPTALETKAASETATETPVTPNAIVLPSPLEPNPTATSVNDFGFTVFPTVLQVGEELTLEGILTTEDVDSGKAVLTNDNGDTVNLLLDSFTATMGNKQRVQITGIVETPPDTVENAIRVTAINMLDADLSQTDVIDPVIEAQITPTITP